MKNKVLLIVLALFLAATFSVAASGSDGLWIGPTGLYKYFVEPGEEIDFDSENFAFGLDARLRLSLLEGSILAVYVPLGDDNAVLSFANIGVNTNLGPVNVGASVGAAFIYSEELDDSFDAGVNLKITADLILGNVSVGAYYLFWEDDFEDIKLAETGLVGFSVLFRL